MCERKRERFVPIEQSKREIVFRSNTVERI